MAFFSKNKPVVIKKGVYKDFGEYKCPGSKQECENFLTAAPHFGDILLLFSVVSFPIAFCERTKNWTFENFIFSSLVHKLDGKVLGFTDWALITSLLLNKSLSKSVLFFLNRDCALFGIQYCMNFNILLRVTNSALADLLAFL